MKKALLVPFITLSLAVGASTTPATGASFDIPQMYEPLTNQWTGPKPVYHPGAPVPQPFSPDYLGGYVSDVSSYQYGVYWEVVRLFDSLRVKHPEVMAANLDKSIAINNQAASSPALIKRAQNDAAADKEGVMEAVAPAMGKEFGQAFSQALAEHRLPKTEFLLGNGYAARAGGLASSTFPEKYYFRNPRPYEVAPGQIKKYNQPGRNYYLTSPSFPSGHTNQATWITTLMAFMLPEIGPQLVYRGAESGQSRVIMGVHYPLDVIGGRMTGQAAAADRLNDPRMKYALAQASQEIRAEMKWRTGKTIEQLVASDVPSVPTYQIASKYEPFMGYGFAPIYHTDAPMIVPQAAPVLLEAAYPHLNWDQRREVLRLTADPAGNPLDWQGPEGSWQRINLAKALTANVRVNPDGSVSVS